MKPAFRLGLLAILLAACSRGVNPPTVATIPATLPATESLAASTSTPFQPTPTPEPMAAEVNGTGITQEAFQAELARYRAAGSGQPAPQDQDTVLNDLINQTLLAQAAAENGYTADDAAIQKRMDDLASQLGGKQALADWMATHGYQEDSFRQDLKRAAAAAWMRDKIAAGVPETAEQVHVRQILVNDAGVAQQALAQLRAGSDFADLAAQYDPVSEGDLGWFPRGYLPDPKIEAAAFNLQPGEFSEVIETATGFHILEVIERDPQRPLDPDARLTLQEKALVSWLEQRRSQSKIEVLLPPPT